MSYSTTLYISTPLLPLFEFKDRRVWLLFQTFKKTFVVLFLHCSRQYSLIVKVFLTGNFLAYEVLLCLSKSKFSLFRLKLFSNHFEKSFHINLLPINRGIKFFVCTTNFGRNNLSHCPKVRIQIFC